MPLNLSRQAKNRLLVVCCSLLWLVLAQKLRTAPELVSQSLQTWTLLAPPVLLLSLLRILFMPQSFGPSNRPRAWAKGLDAALFLTMGAAIGLTIAGALRAPGDVWILEWLWLGIAVATAALHYSPSEQDEYVG